MIMWVGVPERRSLRYLLIAGAFLLTMSAWGQRIWVAEYAHQADLRIFIADYPHQAHLQVWEAEYAHQAASGAGLWHFTAHPHQADLKVFFTQYAHQANLVITLVEYRHQAGWRQKPPKLPSAAFKSLRQR